MAGENQRVNAESLTQSCTGDLPFLLSVVCDPHLEARDTERRKDKWKGKFPFKWKRKNCSSLLTIK